MDGDGPQPLALYVSRLCEAFHCLPSQIDDELARVPVGFLESVVEARAYEGAYRFYKSNKDTKDRSELVQMAKRITFELAQAQIASKAKTKKK